VQRADNDTTQRLHNAPAAGQAGGDRTVRLQAAGDDATLPALETARAPGGRPQNIIVDSNTRLGISHAFDSSEALQRLTEPGKKDHARLAASPQPSNFLVRMWRDLEMRVLVGILLGASLLGLFLAAC
jgi:hypothetical protein